MMLSSILLCVDSPSPSINSCSLRSVPWHFSS